MNEIDRCDGCGGSGRDPRLEFNRKLREAHAAGTLGCDLLDVAHGEPGAGPCPECHGRGYLDPVASLARAVRNGTSLAWCMAHAREYPAADPLPEMWRAAAASSRRALGAAVLDRTGARDVMWAPTPTLAEVLDAARAGR